MTSRIAALTAGALLVVAAVVGVTRLPGGASPPTHVVGTPRSSPAGATPTAPAALDPLTIAAMRARAYPASTLTAVRSDGDQGGYVNTRGVVRVRRAHRVRADERPRRRAARRRDGRWSSSATGTSTRARTSPTTARTRSSSPRSRAPATWCSSPTSAATARARASPRAATSRRCTRTTCSTWSARCGRPARRPHRIGLFGHSLGGYEALRAMVISTDIRAVVFMSAVVGSLDDIFFNWSTVTATPTAATAAGAAAGRAVTHRRPGHAAHQPRLLQPGVGHQLLSGSTAAVQIDEDVADTRCPSCSPITCTPRCRRRERAWSSTRPTPATTTSSPATAPPCSPTCVAFYRAHL